MILKEGTNLHIDLKKDQIEFMFKDGDKSYNVKKEGLVKKGRSILGRIRDVFTGVFDNYIIVFREGEPDPIIRYSAKVSSRILGVVDRATILTAMFKELFRGRGGLGLFIFIFIILGVVAIIFMRLQGMI